jgi:DNA polymerase-3 subunit epsilon
MLRQTSFDDLGTPLSGTTFCVLDLETTGGSPEDDSITEVAALKVTCGEPVGSFQTLVDPGRPIPAYIRAITGISDELLRGAASIDEVLPTLLEFMRGSVIVAHNARFDVGFLNIALARRGYPKIENRVIDTALLARKILAGEVPNHKLSTLALHLRTAHQPCHRAFPDVLATVDLLHHLIERVAGYGVTTLEDLCSMSSTRLDGTFRKIAMTDGLPRGIGVYRFLGARGETLYVGKATDIRSRVRSYFFGDPRRRMRNLMREVQDLRVECHGSLLEAEVAEARAIALEKPPYNRRGKNESHWYLKIVAAPPRVAPARAPKDDGAVYLGPYPSLKTARALLDAMRSALPIHRCAEPRACDRCAFHELRTCSGGDAASHADAVAALLEAVRNDHQMLATRLAAKMHRFAGQERFEEAEETRTAGATLLTALRRASEIHSLAEAGDLILAVGERILLIRRGSLVAAAPIPDDVDLATLVQRLRADAPEVPATGYLSAAAEREASVIASWLRRQDGTARVVAIEGCWATPVGCRPTAAFRKHETKR